jgi:hypothetical protein
MENKLNWGDLKQRVVNVSGDLWYDIIDYSTYADGTLAEVKGTNGTWYDVKKVKGLI